VRRAHHRVLRLFERPRQVQFGQRAAVKHSGAGDEQAGGRRARRAMTGCRLSEALALASADLDAVAGSMTIRSLKKRGQGSAREVPVPDQLVNQRHQLVRPAGHAEFWQWGCTTAWGATSKR